VPNDHHNTVMRLVLERQGEFQRMESHRGTTQVEFFIPARSLIGLRTRMLTSTQGTAIMHHNFLEYRPLKGASAGRATGVYISKNTAKVTAYSVDGLAGSLFVAPGEEVYEGQVVGEHGREKGHGGERHRPETAHQHAGVRAADSKAAVKPPMRFSMEMALEYIEDRRAGRNHPEVDPDAEAVPERERAEEVRAAEGVVTAGRFP